MHSETDLAIKVAQDNIKGEDFAHSTRLDSDDIRETHSTVLLAYRSPHFSTSEKCCSEHAMPT
jgi:hypothetical protein